MASAIRVNPCLNALIVEQILLRVAYVIGFFRSLLTTAANSLVNSALKLQGKIFVLFAQ